MGGVILPNVNVPGSSSYVAARGSYLAFRNEITKEIKALPDFDITVLNTTIGPDFDPLYLLDGMSTSGTSIAQTEGVEITFVNELNPNGIIDANCVCLSGINFESGNVALITVLIDQSGDFEYDTTVSFAPELLTDGAPILIPFTADKLIRRVKVYFSGGTDVTLSNIYLSKAIVFKSQPDIGYQPGKWNNLDEVNRLKSQANIFGPSILKRKGTEEVVRFSGLDIFFIDTEYRRLLDGFRGQQVFFAWDPDINPEDCMFGSARFESAKYDTSTTSSMRFTIKGVSR